MSGPHKFESKAKKKQKNIEHATTIDTEHATMIHTEHSTLIYIEDATMIHTLTFYEA